MLNYVLLLGMRYFLLMQSVIPASSCREWDDYQSEEQEPHWFSEAKAAAAEKKERQNILNEEFKRRRNVVSI